jgi:hypothetical protein
MPSLKDLHCFIELPGTDTKLREFGTKYSDGCVETFVAVPNGLQPFAICLNSSDFIAPGLAIYVFIDGVYQCNRNRKDLKLRRPPDRKSLATFRVRQREETQKNGSMIAREWRFEKLNIGQWQCCGERILADLPQQKPTARPKRAQKMCWKTSAASKSLSFAAPVRETPIQGRRLLTMSKPTT